MKKKLLKSALGFFAVFMGINSVNANCSYSEKADLNNEVANVKVKYEANKDKVHPEGYGCDESEGCEIYQHYININILNLSENFYISVKDDASKKTTKYYYSQLNDEGILQLRWENVDVLNNYTITVYSSSKTSCPNTKMKVMRVTTPRWNVYSENSICEEIPDYYLCQEYVTYKEDPTYGEFREKTEAEVARVQEEKKKEEKSWGKKFLDFIKENKVVIIVCTAVIIVAGAGVVIVIRKKNEL